MTAQVTVASPGVSLSNNTVANVTSKALPAGSYLIWGQVDFALSAATCTNLQAGLSLTSATMPTQAGGGGLGPEPLCISPVLLTLLTDVFSVICLPTMLVLVSPSTLYLVARTTFSVGTVSAYGTMTILQMSYLNGMSP